MINECFIIIVGFDPNKAIKTIIFIQILSYPLWRPLDKWTQVLVKDFFAMYLFCCDFCLIVNPFALIGLCAGHTGWDMIHNCTYLSDSVAMSTIPIINFIVFYFGWNCVNINNKFQRRLHLMQIFIQAVLFSVDMMWNVYIWWWWWIIQCMDMEIWCPKSRT